MNNYSALTIDDSCKYEDVDISIVEFSKHKGLPIWNQERIKNEHCNLTYIKEGRAICYIGDKPFLLNKGDFIFITRDDHIKSHIDKRSRTECYTLIFDYSYRNKDYKKLPFPTVFHVNSNIILNDLYEKMNRIWEEKFIGYELKARAIVLQTKTSHL